MAADDGATGSGQAAIACPDPVGTRTRKLAYPADPEKENAVTSTFVLVASGDACNLLFRNDSAKVERKQGAAGGTPLAACGRRSSETGSCRTPVSRLQSSDNNNSLKGKSVRQAGVITASSGTGAGMCAPPALRATAAGPRTAVTSTNLLHETLPGGSAHARGEAGHAA